MFWLALLKVRLGLAGHFQAFGYSMEPIIPSGSRVTLRPLNVERLEQGDIVAVKVGAATMLHLVKTIDAKERRVEISGTSGPPDGWTSFDRVYAICTHVQGIANSGADGKTRRRSWYRTSA